MTGVVVAWKEQMKEQMFLEVEAQVDWRWAWEIKDTLIMKMHEAGKFERNGQI